jgi:HEAT repeat protein
LSDEKPEALLKSALEKIVYFEARSTQLVNDAGSTRSELDRVKNDLASASQREIELRRVIAELEVRATRAHSEREEMARVVDALRRERAELVGKMLEASRIHGLDQGVEGFDLAQFIATLRSEVLVQRDGNAPVQVGAAPAQADTVTSVAHELKAQGRITVSANDLATLRGALDFPGRSEETLFGFSVRELSALDPSARMRAAERLEALRHPAAAPALATALHGESEPSVQVALLSALASLAQAEAVPVVQPLLTSTSPDVRISALKALLKLDPSAAGPHLAAATKDPDKAVRRRASLLALGLSGTQAFDLGAQAIRDEDADVRALAALVLGASNAEIARPMLLDAMRDADQRVRRAASQSLSRLLGQDVTSLVSLDDAHRRREVRRISTLPSAPTTTLSERSARVGRPRVAPVLAAASHAVANSPAAQHAVVQQAAVQQAAQQVAAQHAVAQQVAVQQAAAQHVVAQHAVAQHTAAQQVVAQHAAAQQVAALQVVTPPAAVQQTAVQQHAVAQHVVVQRPVAPLQAAVQTLATPSAAMAPRSRVAVLEVEEAAPAPSPELASAVLRELRASIRGRQLPELSSGIGANTETTMRVCGELLSQGQIVRRGLKYFVA